MAHSLGAAMEGGLLFKHYTPRATEPVDAVRVSSSNISEIRNALGADAHEARDTPPEVWGDFMVTGPTGGGERVAVRIGDWLVLTRAGYQVLPEHQFHGRYREDLTER